MPLRAVGLAGNPVADIKLFRAKLIALLPKLVDGSCSLRSIDEHVITPGAPSTCRRRPLTPSRSQRTFAPRTSKSQRTPTSTDIASR